MTLPGFDDRPETARGRMLYEALLAIHAHIRRELAGVERLAAAVLEALRSNSGLWQFQVSCLRYCGFVHMHHNAEDIEFFDELEQTNPAIKPVVERLRSEHRAVSDYLDTVEAAARALTDDDGREARRAVADALKALKGYLLAHLDYEERTSPALLDGYATLRHRMRGPSPSSRARGRPSVALSRRLPRP
jgi:hemerythrin-like domain-containing protein